MIRGMCTAAIFACATSVLASAQPLTVKIAYLGRADRSQTISSVEMPTANNGIAGAQVAVEDNNTTGKFLNESFTIEDVQLKDEDDPAAAITQLADHGIALVVSELPADMLLKAADAGRGRGLLLFNVGAIDDRLRQEDCRANVIHSAPTRTMLADGLAQYLVWKHWTR